MPGVHRNYCAAGSAKRPGAQILHLHGQGTTWEHRAMSTERQDIDRAHRIARASGPAVRATVYPAVLAPLPAYRACLRGIGFAEGERPSRLVVEQLDDLAGTGRTHLLRLLAPDALGGVIEWLTHVAGGVREGLGHLACWPGGRDRGYAAASCRASCTCGVAAACSAANAWRRPTDAG